MLQTQVLKLVEALSPTTKVESGWDRELPSFAEIKLDGSTLVIAKCGSRFVLTVVVGDALRSTLVSKDLTDSEISTASNYFAQAASSRAAPVASPVQEPRARAVSERLREQPLPRSTGTGVRDPNAPPGFEDEHLLRQRIPAGPSIAFDPDRDIYPPGGRHPQLSSFDAYGPDFSGGMNPTPFGSSRPPNIREDPTTPFDRSQLGRGGPSFGGSGPSPFGF